MGFTAIPRISSLSGVVHLTLVQVINNACATQAILSVLMNIEDSSVTLGPTLQVRDEGGTGDCG